MVFHHKLKAARIMAITFAALLIFCADSFSSGAVIGKVSLSGKALQGATVGLYSVAGGRVTGKPDYLCAATGADGSFDIQVAPGQYFMIAWKYADPAKPGAEGDVYSYYGGNPVVAGEGERINVGVSVAPIVPVAETAKPGGTGIRGRVYAEGKPLSRTRVTLYQDASTIFRGIGYASAVTNDQGDFSFTLEPGEYYVIARKRMGDDRMGPLGQGDFFGFAHDNPVKVEKDRFTVISVSATGKNLKVKEGGQDVTLGGTVKAGNTTIGGVIRDKTGKPVAKVYAMAYRDSMMTQKPDFISAATGEDGAYSISLSEGGEYFIGARNTMGGPAERGDLLGRYSGNEDHSVKISTGQKVGGVEIVVEPVE